MTWEAYLAKARQMGAIVEAFVEGEQKRSPSAQFRIDPLGAVECISTHDQVLGGPGGQVFLGCGFPADEPYRLAIQEEGAKVAALLAQHGVLGRFGIDFVSVPRGRRMAQLRNRDQFAEGRHHPPVSHAPVPDRGRL